MYLFGRHSTELRKGNKIAISVGLIPPMNIPEEIFGFYNNVYSIEQNGNDFMGLDTIVRIK